MIQDECEDEKCASTQFLQMEKNQLFDLQEHLERYCNISPVSAVNSAKHDINLVKSYLLPILVNEREIEPTVVKKANHFISSKFGVIRFLHIMNFLFGATSLDSFLKAYKTSETESYIPYKWVDNTEKLPNRELSPYDIFFGKLRSGNPLEAENTEYVNLL